MNFIIFYRGFGLIVVVNFVISFMILDWLRSEGFLQITSVEEGLVGAGIFAVVNLLMSITVLRAVGGEHRFFFFPVSWWSIILPLIEIGFSIYNNWDRGCWRGVNNFFPEIAC